MPSVYGDDRRRLPGFSGGRVEDPDDVEVDDLTAARPIDDIDNSGRKRLLLVARHDDPSGHHLIGFGGSIEKRPHVPVAST
jgi:hypothetical protein